MRLHDLFEAWGRDGLQKAWDKESKKTTGMTIDQRRKMYQKSGEDTKKRQAQLKKDFPELDEGDIVQFRSRKTDQEKFAGAWEKQQDNKHRAGVGSVPCQYCDDEWCDFDCDESQAGGFNESEEPENESK